MSDTTEHTAPGRRLIEESFPLKKVSETRSTRRLCGTAISRRSISGRRADHSLRRGRHCSPRCCPIRGTSRGGRAQQAHRVTDPLGTENGPELEKFRAEIRAAYGGRAPRVLDMFAGGGAIPFEAMRLGCDVTAVDFNPVAWFLLRCTLEYPQRFAGKSWPIPRRLERYLDGNGDNGNSSGKGKARSAKATAAAQQAPVSAPWMEDQARLGNLAEHVRAWGGWVLAHARRELRDFYPAVDGLTPLTYLWARTVPCPDPTCGTDVPLLKTLWLSKVEGHA